jgi:hypothetical protein
MALGGPLVLSIVAAAVIGGVGPAAAVGSAPATVEEVCGDALPADVELTELDVVRLYFHSPVLPYLASIANGGHDDSVHPMDRRAPTNVYANRWYTNGGPSDRSSYLAPSFEAAIPRGTRVVCAATTAYVDDLSYTTDVALDASLYVDEARNASVTSLPLEDDGIVFTSSTTRVARLRFPAMDLAGDELAIQFGLPGPASHLQYDGQIQDSHLDIVLRRAG